ncbi:MAG: hypothetical protein RLZZ67_209 [Candidatus Parcubacteria bacterium]|jgi:UPF0755 protein
MNDGSLRYISEPPQVPLLDVPHRRKFFGKKFTVAVSALVFVCAVLYFQFIKAPGKFPVDTIISIPQGETLSGIAYNLDKQGVIKSAFVFKSFFVIFGGTKGLKAGDYFLDHAQNAVVLAWRMTHSDYNLQNIKVTIPEGWTSFEIAAFISKDKRFSHFSAKEFIKMAAPYEGYLFPDTYLLLPNITAQNVLETMLSNYKERTASLSGQIMVFGRPIKDIITMASIIEEEARTEESRKIIAGILWKRFDEGMLLQVDATFVSVNGKKASSDLTLDDLKIDSPYNTYVYKGLPPGPISNPGLGSISATINPIKTKYYFYLSDKQGNMHYGITHDQHVENKFKYLK